MAMGKQCEYYYDHVNLILWRKEVVSTKKKMNSYVIKTSLPKGESSKYPSPFFGGGRGGIDFFLKEVIFFSLSDNIFFLFAYVVYG